MKDKTRLMTIWISSDTYRELIEIERLLVTRKGRQANPNEAVKELVEFWKKNTS